VTGRLLLPGGSRPTLTAVDLAALAMYPQLWRIVELRASNSWVLTPVRVEGRLELLTGARRWLDGWSDAIAIRALTDAKAFRCDPIGGEVWKHEGGLAEVIDGLIELPAPHEPHAPRLVKARAAKLWLPAGRQ
jgi:hypothetical protein